MPKESKKKREEKRDRKEAKKDMGADERVLAGKQKPMSSYQKKIQFWGKTSHQETMGQWRVSYHHEDVDTFVSSLRPEGSPRAQDTTDL